MLVVLLFLYMFFLVVPGLTLQEKLRKGAGSLSGRSFLEPGQLRWTVGFRWQLWQVITQEGIFDAQLLAAELLDGQVESRWFENCHISNFGRRNCAWFASQLRQEVKSKVKLEVSEGKLGSPTAAVNLHLMGFLGTKRRPQNPLAIGQHEVSHGEEDAVQLWACCVPRLHSRLKGSVWTAVKHCPRRNAMINPPLT